MHWCRKDYHPGRIDGGGTSGVWNPERVPAATCSTAGGAAHPHRISIPKGTGAQSQGKTRRQMLAAGPAGVAGALQALPTRLRHKPLLRLRHGRRRMSSAVRDRRRRQGRSLHPASDPGICFFWLESEAGT